MPGLSINRWRTSDGWVAGIPAMNEIALKNKNLTSADIDARLNYLASIGIAGKIINIQGNGSRTTVSEVAHTFLTTTLQNYVVEDPAWYGFRLNEADSSFDVTRIASDMNLHATLPIQSQMKACLLKDDETVNYYLKADDVTKKADGTPAIKDGTDGMVMVEIPTYYRIVENPLPGVFDHKISFVPVPGWQKVEKYYVGAYEASVQRSNNKLSSVINTTADFRGGNNNAAWDASGNTLLGRPATALSETTLRTYARNRGSNKWNLEVYRNSMLMYELFIIEFATLNTQKAVNTALTAQGYKQGGLGAGVTEAVSAEWNAFSSYYPFVPCGASDSLNNASGEVAITVANFGGAGVNRIFKVPRYRGIEHPFGHIWKWQDGASVFHEGAGGSSKFYTCDNPANFADNTATNYDYRGNLPVTSGYVKKMKHDEKGVLIPSEIGAASNTYFCDYFYTPGLVNGWRAVLRGGAANDGAFAGFGYLYTSNTASSTAAYFGARLCFIP
jgi:hypothetical protein